MRWKLTVLINRGWLNQGGRQRRNVAQPRNMSVLSVLQQYFSGSLKDAAKSIGEFNSTVRGESMEGMEATLKFDPITGGLVAAGSTNQEFEPKKCSLIPSNNHVRDTDVVTHYTISATPTSCIDIETSTMKMEVFCGWK
ncbi:unnamed protein product [Fraxinus pennsylvanica]|uniref:Uncharacterized protein n=1 Tax=Fraxinus pennsylvanica TaxID=56036 RepID=A0AAD1Z4S7_9LAMI|nr:unnamed protein product [Fraxinus pennsylvanica]